MLIRLIRYVRKLTLFAPIFFVGGLTFGLFGIPVAGFGFMLRGALDVALPGPSAFMATYAFVGAMFAFFWGATDLLVITLGTVVVFLPVLFSMLAKIQLMLFSHRS
jgi:hypothetical protein